MRKKGKMAMNKTFQQVYDFCYKRAKEEVTHKQRVTRLYRALLKNEQHWNIARENYMNRCQEIHDKFRETQFLSEEEGKALIQKGDAHLLSLRHPDPYKICWMPGGSKFMRNPTPPVELQYRGEEIPDSAYTGTNTPMHLDSIPISIRPIDQPYDLSKVY